MAARPRTAPVESEFQMFDKGFHKLVHHLLALPNSKVCDLLIAHLSHNELPRGCDDCQKGCQNQRRYEGDNHDRLWPKDLQTPHCLN